MDSDDLDSPDPTEVARRLIAVARSRPGIAVDEHLTTVLDSFPATERPRVEEVVDRVLDDLVDGPLHWLPGDQTLVVPDVVNSMTFTHRFNASEAEIGVLTAGFDLGVLDQVDTIHLADGTELEAFSADRHHLAWRGPSGWLAGFAPGDLLACTIGVDLDDDFFLAATVSIEVVHDEPRPTEAVVAAVRAAYEDLVAEPGLPVTGHDLALWVLFHHPGTFASAQPPLDELCEAAGLERRGGVVADDEQIWRNDLLHQRLHTAWAHVPEPHWRRVVGNALSVLDDPDAPIDDIRATLDECAEPEVLDVLADTLFGHYLDPADAFELGRADAPGRLFELVDRAEALAKGPRERATAHYLACVLHERCGEPVRAEEHLRQAAEAQPRLGPVVERAGWYRFDRGDASGAMRWWRTLSEPHPSARTIEPFLRPAVNDHKLGRNDPCWCGSGRKFKQCHQHAATEPALPDRVGWLCRKASLWLEHSTGDVRTLIADLAAVRALGDPDASTEDLVDLGDEFHDRLGEAFADPIVFDAALTEGRLFGLFLRERGALLPEDEQLLVASWRMVDRSVHEVVAVDPGVGLTLRDLATGDVVEVRERSASTQIAVGERYCARVVPDGASHQIIGGVFEVRAGHESTVLDLCASGDPFALCAWAGALARPPRIVHTPGLIDELFDRDAIQDLFDGLDDSTDPDAAMAVLQAELARQAQTRWLDEHVPALGGLTPREAAADPTRREQLERLLAEFDTDPAEDLRAAGLPGGFTAFSYDVAALRRELGLD